MANYTYRVLMHYVAESRNAYTVKASCAHQTEQAAGEGRPQQQTCAQRMVHVLPEALTRHRNRGLSGAPADDGGLHH